MVLSHTESFLTYLHVSPLHFVNSVTAEASFDSQSPDALFMNSHASQQVASAKLIVNCSLNRAP